MIADSLEVLLELFRIKGIKAKVFNSSPTHLNNRDGEERTMNTLVAKQIINKIKEGFIIIGKKGNPIDGAWAHKLYLAYLSIHVDVKA